MAEAAGLVLGAIPIVISALEKYKIFFERYRKYHNNIKTLHSGLKLQNRTLKRTLELYGLHNLTETELRKCLEQKFPEIAGEVLHIIQEMGRVTTALMLKLGIDLETKVDEMPKVSRSQWKRIKNSVTAKECDEVIDFLRKHNGDLERCLQLETSEVQAEDDNRTVVQLVKRFDISRCDNLRLRLSSLHRALATGLRCATCLALHQAALDLGWHLYESADPPDFDLAVSYQAVPSTQQTETRWRKLQVTPSSAAQSSPATPSTSADTSFSVSPSPPSQSSTRDLGRPLRPRSPLRFLPNRARASQTDSSPRLSMTVPSGSNDLFLQPIATPASPPSESTMASLCHILASDTGEGGVLKYADEDHGHDFYLRYNSSNGHKITRLVGIESLYLPPYHKKLALKARCGLAAYAAWSVLHLANGPWLDDNWDGRQVGILLEKPDNDGEKFSERPCFLFDVAAPSQTPPPGGYVGDHQAGNPAYHDTLSEQDNRPLGPNTTIIFLGILLVELCLGRLGAQAQQEQQQQSPSSSSSTIRSRYKSAKRDLDEVYRLAGTSYGDAAKKCINFVFPGRDVNNTFEIKTFRVTFYREVVAPVQATYSQFPK